MDDQHKSKKQLIEELRNTRIALKAPADEKQFRDILVSLNDSVFVTDDNDRFTFICENCDIIFGYTAQEVNEMSSIRELLGGNLFDLAELRSKSQITNVKRKITAKNGEQRSLLITIKLVNIFGGTRLYSCHDVTDLGQVEFKYKKLEQKLQIALENGIADAWEMDLVTGECSYGDRWAASLGYAPGEIPLTIEGVQSVIHPEDVPKNLAILNDYLEGRAPIYETECRVRTKSGQWSWVQSRGKTIETDELGKARRLIGTNFNIDRQKQAESALRESEKKIRDKLEAVLSPQGDIGNLELGDIIDVQAFQSLMDDFFNLNQIGMALLDINGKILVSTGWQDICTKFHRVHPETNRNCIESDTTLSEGVAPGEFKIYHCKNHMWDIATPIMVGEKHLGNLFLGQFFFEDEPLDLEIFRDQAEKYGFDEHEYLAALDRAPRWSHERVQQAMSFYAQIGTMVSKLSYANLKLARSTEEQEQATAALLKSEAQYRLLAENITDVIWTMDMNLRFDYISPSIYELRGYTVEEFHEQSLAEVMSPESFELAMKLLKEKLDLISAGDPEGWKPINFEAVQYRKDGSRIITNNNTRILKGPDGRPNLILGVTHDITERVLANQRIIDEKNRAETYLNIAGVMFVRLNADETVGMVNPKTCAVLGYSREEIEGQNWFDKFIPERLRPGIRQVFSQIMAGKMESVEHYENCVLHKDGQERTISWHNTPIYNTEGNICGLLGSGEDITEEKEAKDQLARALEISKRFADENREFFNAAQNVLAEEDFDQIARRLFDACRRLTGAVSGYVALLSEDGQENELLFLEDGGLPCSVNPALPMPIRGLRAECYKLGKAVWDNNFMESKWMNFMPKGHVYLKNVLFAPLNIDGKTVGIIGISNKPDDFTEHDARIAETLGDLAAIALSKARTKQSLKKSELWNRTLFDTSPDALFVIDGDRNIYDANITAVRRYGYTREELLSLKVDALTPPEMRDKVPVRLEQTFQLEHSQFEWCHQTRDGRLINVEISSRLIDSGGIRPFIFSSVRDISDRKNAETEQKRQAELFEAMFENMPVMITFFDPQLKALRANKEFEKKIGWTSAEIRQIDLMEQIYPDPEYRKMVTDFMVNAAREWKEFTVKTKSGINLETIWTNIGLSDETKIGIGLDLSESKKAEKDRLLLEEQLHQAHKMESIGRLAGGVAHDFNNLLTVIQGYSDIAYSSLGENDPGRADLMEIKKAADSAASLTNQLLAFSRKQIISPTILSLNVAVAKSEKMIKRILEENIEFVFIPGQGIVNVLIDQGQIDQMIINLAINARDAMPNGGKLTIETSSVIMDEKRCLSCGAPFKGRFVMLAVSDTGVGMDTITIKNVFEPFYTTKEKGKGTGLGLSTVHGIVHQSGGHINVYSESEFGTTFKIYLPLVDKKEDVKEEKSEILISSGYESILLVEDQDMVRKLAVRALKSYGYKVIEANNGDEALTIFTEASQKFDLLLTDVVMPKMSGKELYDRLIALQPDLKALFMSGYTENAIAHHGVLEEGINFIQKPFRPQDLAERVRRLLDEQS